MRNIVRNFPSYILPRDENISYLMCGIDQHIPNHLRSSAIKTEFSQIKIKSQRTCENYSKIRVPYKYKQVINNLAKNISIAMMKQDKGRG